MSYDVFLHGLIPERMTCKIGVRRCTIDKRPLDSLHIEDKRRKQNYLIQGCTLYNLHEERVNERSRMLFRCIS